jgi:glucokinase
VKVYFGVDVGGTSVKTALVRETGEILTKHSFATQNGLGLTEMAAQLKGSLHDMVQQTGLAQTDVVGMGVGVPAFLDVEQGVVISAINLGWSNVPLASVLEGVFHLPVALENDANVAALGESWAGAGQQHSCVLCVTVGTGIGGGIVLNGSLFRGVNGMAGEIGHLVLQRENGIQCNCGLTGCLETLASATAIVRACKEKQKRGQISPDVEITGAKDVFALAETGDTAALDVIGEAGRWLGYGLAVVATTINPDVIVIGGGVSKAREALLTPVRSAFRRYSVPRVADAADIRFATLGNDAGVVGAARLSMQQLSANPLPL